MDTSTVFNISTWQGKVVASTAAVAGIYGLYLVARKPRRDKKELDVEKLVSVLDAFAQGIEEAAQAIAKQEKMVRQRMKMAGRSISEEEMYMYCQSEFEQLMMTREAAIYEKFKTTEGACKKAWQKYRKDPSVAKVEARIVTGASVFERKEVEIPDSFTEEKLLELVGELVDATTKAMESVVAELAKRGITPQSNQSQFLSLFQRLFQQKSQKIQTEIPAKHGITEAVYNSAIQKYQDSPAFQVKMELLKANQQRIFEAAGLNF